MTIDDMREELAEKDAGSLDQAALYSRFLDGFIGYKKMPDAKVVKLYDEMNNLKEDDDDDEDEPLDIGEADFLGRNRDNEVVYPDDDLAERY